MDHSQSRSKARYPRYRVEAHRDYFVISERSVRSFSFVYRTCSLFGRFETREAAQAALDAKRAA